MNKHINKNKKPYKKPAVPEVTDSSTNRKGRRVKQLSPFKQRAIKMRIEIENQKKEGHKIQFQNIQKRKELKNS